MHMDSNNVSGPFCSALYFTVLRITAELPAHRLGKHSSTKYVSKSLKMIRGTGRMLARKPKCLRRTFRTHIKRMPHDFHMDIVAPVSRPQTCTIYTYTKLLKHFLKAQGLSTT